MLAFLTTKKLEDRNLTVTEAYLSRDLIAMSLYDNLFNWLVQKINSALSPIIDSSCKFIAIIDMTGFENLEINSLE